MAKRDSVRGKSSAPEADTAEETGAGTSGPIMLRLLDHLMTSGEVIATLCEQVRNLQTGQDSMFKLIREEGAAKCIVCGTVRNNDNEETQRIETGKNRVWKLLMAIVTNKPMWVTLGIIGIIVLVLLEFKAFDSLANIFYGEHAE